MKIGLAGFGKMGRGIFHLFGSSPFSVTVLVRTGEKADKNNRQVETRLKRSLRKGMLTEEEFRERAGALGFTTDLGDFASCDLVIEALPEDFEAKAEFLARLEGVVSPEALIVSNTSGLSLTRLAGGLRRKERFCGLHFFHPIPLSTIVEIIKWDGTAPETVERLEELCRRAGKRPIVVGDFPGSVVNPILACYYCEGLYLLEQGLAPPSLIDSIAGRFTRIGPCESIDALGIEFFEKLFEDLEPYRPPGLDTPALLRKLVGDGRLGKDSGAGLYLYTGAGVRDDDPAYYLDPHQRHSSPNPEEGEEAVARRLKFALLAGLLYVAGKGKGDARDLDFAISEVLGMEEGPLALAEGLGREGLAGELALLSERAGRRFDPRLADLLPT